MGVYNPDNPNYFDVTTDQSPTTGFHENGSTPTPGSVSGATGSSGDGGSNWWDGISQFLPGGAQGINGNVSLSMLIPAMAQAYQQYKNSGTYRDLGREAAGMANPFGQYRQQYGDELSALYKDPSQIANTPGYKFTMNQTLDQTQKRLAGMGYGGSSEMQTALADQAAGLASKTWDTERNALMQLAGAQFNPAYAAQMMMEGGKLSVDSQNAALAALFSPFGNRAGANTNATRAGGGPGGGSPGTSGLKMPPSQALQRLQQAGFNPQSAASLLRLLVSDPGSIDPATMQILQDSGVYDPSLGSGGVDQAPPGYDYSGYGGYGTASGDPTLQGINFGAPDNSTNFNFGQGGGDGTGYSFMQPGADNVGMNLGGDTGADVVTTPYIDTPAPDAMPDFSSSDYSWMFGG